MIDIVAENGWLASTLRIMQLLQMVIQARWIDEPAVITLPHINKEHLPLFSSLPAPLPVLCATTINNYNRLVKAFSKEFHEEQIHQVNLYYTFRFLYFFLSYSMEKHLLYSKFLLLDTSSYQTNANAVYRFNVTWELGGWYRKKNTATNEL